MYFFFDFMAKGPRLSRTHGSLHCYRMGGVKFTQTTPRPLPPEFFCLGQAGHLVHRARRRRRRWRNKVGFWIGNGRLTTSDDTFLRLFLPEFWPSRSYPWSATVVRSSLWKNNCEEIKFPNGFFPDFVWFPPIYLWKLLVSLIKSSGDYIICRKILIPSSKSRGKSRLFEGGVVFWTWTPSCFSNCA